jgi:hypothetical protein
MRQGATGEAVASAAVAAASLAAGGWCVDFIGHLLKFSEA